jgi:hypothetical protein
MISRVKYGKNMNARLFFIQFPATFVDVLLMNCVSSDLLQRELWG